MPQRYREHTRIRGFDYRENHAYFVTICTGRRQAVFGNIENGQMHLSQRGKVVESCWYDIVRHHPFVELDAMVVMPNHFHGILCFVGNDVAATPASPIPSRNGPAARSLSAVIGSFKSAATRTVNRLRTGTGAGLWQSNFYEHVIRSDCSHEGIREYIRANPSMWLEDEHNPESSSPIEFASWLARQEWATQASQLQQAASHPEGTLNA